MGKRLGKRWIWFILYILISAGLFAIYMLVLRKPSAGFMPPVDMDLAMNRKAAELGWWFGRGWILTGVVSGFLLYSSYFLQLLHAELRRHAWLVRWPVAYLLPLIGGLLIRGQGINWAMDQHPDTLIREALANMISAKNVTLSDALLPLLLWKSAALVDLLVINLLGCIIGFVIYRIARRAINL